MTALISSTEKVADNLTTAIPNNSADSYTKASFEKRFRFLSKLEVRGILGKPCLVDNDTWVYNLKITDEEADHTYIRVNIWFNNYEDGSNYFQYNDYTICK